MANANHTYSLPIPHFRRKQPLLILSPLTEMLGTVAHADWSLTIEDLITDKIKVRLTLSLSYTNSEHDGVSLVPTGSKSYISVPTKS